MAVAIKKGETYFTIPIRKSLIDSHVEEMTEILFRSRPGFDKEDQDRLQQIVRFVIDRRNILPVLNDLGERLKASYYAQHHSEMPHSTVQIGHDVSIQRVHNEDVCRTLRDKFQADYKTDAVFLRCQQLYENADYNEMLSKNLPDVELLLRDTILGYLKELGWDVSAPMFDGFISDALASPIAALSLFQEAAGGGPAHGLHSHLIQFIALLKNKLIDRELLGRIFQHKDAWPIL